MVSNTEIQGKRLCGTVGCLQESNHIGCCDHETKGPRDRSQPSRFSASAPLSTGLWNDQQNTAKQQEVKLAGSDLYIGDRVEAVWDGTDDWYPGFVANVNDDLSLNIQFDDGDSRPNVQRIDVRFPGGANSLKRKHPVRKSQPHCTCLNS